MMAPPNQIGLWEVRPAGRTDHSPLQDATHYCSCMVTRLWEVRPAGRAEHSLPRILALMGRWEARPPGRADHSPNASTAWLDLGGQLAG